MPNTEPTSTEDYARKNFDKELENLDDELVNMLNKVNIEVYNNEVVSVWFGCALLPFTVHDVDALRAEWLRRDYQSSKSRAILDVSLQN